MGFSGGSYEEVGRWLWNFLTAHAKREHPAVEVEVEAGEGREGRSYGARLILGLRRSEPFEFDYAEVAAQRGSLAWCRAQAEAVRQRVRTLTAGVPDRAGAA
ncbi:MAG TPA: hypothetical protein VNK50_10580 [Calidithermus sp.]|nr:hypothetical protein [Calidithermus sp.]